MRERGAVCKTLQATSLQRTEFMDTSEGPSGGLTTYLVVYVIILAVSGMQILIAYSNVEGPRIFMLMVPPMFMSAGITWLAYRKRNQFRQDVDIEGQFGEDRESFEE